MTIQAVLFDLDGTLLDTLDDIADSANRSLQQLGFPAHAVEAYKIFVGDGIENLVRRVLPEGRADAETIAECVALMKEEYGRRWDRKTRPYEGVAELLDGLTHRGTSMAVFSNKPHESTTLCVTHLLESWQFAVVMGAGQSFPRKPDPAGALHIAGQLGAKPSQIAYVGDTGTDMQTARAAGMYAVGACWGFRTADELREHGAEVLIDRPTQLLDLLDGDAGRATA